MRLSLIALLNAAAQASVCGVSAGTSSTVSGFINWQNVGNAQAPSSTDAVLTNGVSQTSALWSPYTVSAYQPFTVSFTLKTSSAIAGGADGVAFVFQADKRGTHAISGGGGSLLGALHPNGVAPAYGFAIRDYQMTSTRAFYGGFFKSTDTSFPGTTIVSRTSACSSSTSTTCSLDVLISYNPCTKIMSVSARPTGYGSYSFSQTLAVTLGLGSNARVGFTASTGGSAFTHTISAFSFSKTATSCDVCTKLLSGTTSIGALAPGPYLAPSSGCLVSVALTGGSGGSSGSSPNIYNGGAGATFTVNFWNDGVTPFEVSDIAVGGVHGADYPGGGGGATIVRQGATVLAVAAGGGGASYYANGGNAGLPLGAGASGACYSPYGSTCTGGGGGTQTAAGTTVSDGAQEDLTYVLTTGGAGFGGGAGGVSTIPSSTSWVVADGGGSGGGVGGPGATGLYNGGVYNGGGGGAGWWGGAGGRPRVSLSSAAYAAGGGGGSSYVATTVNTSYTGGSLSTALGGDGSATLLYVCSNAASSGNNGPTAEVAASGSIVLSSVPASAYLSGRLTSATLTDIEAAIKSAIVSTAGPSTEHITVRITKVTDATGQVILSSRRLSVTTVAYTVSGTAAALSAVVAMSTFSFINSLVTSVASLGAGWAASSASSLSYAATTTSSSSSTSSFPGGAIAGIVVGLLVVVTIGLLALRRAKPTTPPPTPAALKITIPPQFVLPQPTLQIMQPVQVVQQPVSAPILGVNPFFGPSDSRFHIYALMSVSSGRFLDGRGQEEEAFMTARALSPNDEYLQWTVELVNDGEFALHSVSSKKYLVGDDTTGNSTALMSERSTLADVSSILWLADPMEDGSIGLRARRTGCYLDGSNKDAPALRAYLRHVSGSCARSVTDPPPPPVHSNQSPDGILSATLHCIGGFAKSNTIADSAAVTSREPLVRIAGTPCSYLLDARLAAVGTRMSAPSAVTASPSRCRTLSLS